MRKHQIARHLDDEIFESQSDDLSCANDVHIYDVHYDVQINII